MVDNKVFGQRRKFSVKRRKGLLRGQDLEIAVLDSYAKAI